MKGYDVLGDIETVRELLGLSESELAEKIGVSPPEISRWKSGLHKISKESTERFYSFAYDSGISLNRIKAQIFRDRYEKKGVKLLFHGAKSGIEGRLSLKCSRAGNDFGQGFYLGERLEQAAMFVAAYKASSIYCMSLAPKGLRREEYSVDTEWMLSIAYFRGRLSEYANTPLIKKLAQRAENADYIVAPIADNRMFELIDSFAYGELTDAQCRACLSATDLGMQYIIKTERALGCLKIHEQMYLCEEEKRDYIARRKEEIKISQDKVRLARREYRGEGKYIEEIFA